MKFVGKRQAGEMQMGELIAAFFLSELATFAITQVEHPFILSIIPLILMALLEIVISFLAVKFPIVKKICDFSPSILIDNGKILEKELLKNRITLDELLSLLRLAGYYDLKSVCYAILEPSGQLSVVPFQSKEAPSREDIKIPTSENGFTVALINDGVINQKALVSIRKSEKWLRDCLRKEKIESEKEVFLFASDFSGNYFITKKTTNRKDGLNFK